MPNVDSYHKPELAHHVHQGIAWLSACGEGENTAALSYAAFELRFAVERLAVHYWFALLDGEPKEQDLRDIESFKRVERRIYELAGHQREIDGHFAFMRIVLGAMKIDVPFKTPQVSTLSMCWHECSELCHIAWPLSCSAPEIRTAAFSTLNEVADVLSAHVQSLGWPMLKDSAFVDLRSRFITGEITAEDVLSHLRKTGIWAKVDYANGKNSHFFGEPVQVEPIFHGKLQSNSNHV